VWLYAYVLVKRRSLTFLTVRPHPDALTRNPRDPPVTGGPSRSMLSSRIPSFLNPTPEEEIER